MGDAACWMHQTCIVCGRHVERQDPDVPYCRDCERDARDADE